MERDFQVGVYDIDPSQVVFKSRLKPGRMLLVDTEKKAVIQDVELKKQIAQSRPHSQWLKEQVMLRTMLLATLKVFIMVVESKHAILLVVLHIHCLI